MNNIKPTLECHVCGEIIEWANCDFCDGVGGYPCDEREQMTECPFCDGAGGSWVCPNLRSHYPVPTCEVCGQELVYEECDFCGGSGYAHLWMDDPEWWCPGDPDEELCAYCDGVGGWWVCPMASRHPVLNSEQEQPHAG